MNAFPFDQCPRKDRAKEWRARARFEPLGIDSSWKIKKLFLRETLHSKRFSSFLRQHYEDVCKIVLFQKTFTGLQKILFPTLRCLWWLVPAVSHHFAAIPVPRWDFNN